MVGSKSKANPHPNCGSRAILPTSYLVFNVTLTSDLLMLHNHVLSSSMCPKNLNLSVSSLETSHLNRNSYVWVVYHHSSSKVFKTRCSINSDMPSLVLALIRSSPTSLHWNLNTPIIYPMNEKHMSYRDVMLVSSFLIQVPSSNNLYALQRCLKSLISHSQFSP